jgi:hypothetical protein
MTAIVTVPKASVHENCSVSFCKHDIGTTGQRPNMDSKAVTIGRKDAPNKDFGLCVFALYAAHKF